MNFRNVGTIDRVIRTVAGVAMLVAGWGGFVAGTPGIVLQWLGFVPLVTAAVGFCPLYSPLKLSTRKG